MELLSTTIALLRWQDLLDIGINSYFLFRFWVLFRGTNVLRVLFGLAGVWFAQRMTASIGLIVSNWISQGITAAAALIVVVVFRNEIRGVLQSKDIKGILWDIPHKTRQTPLEVIVESVFDMARQHIGALIVLPGKEDLEELVQHGIGWEGTISREMLISIFWPDNPVHDGAAIVRGERIAEVGAILPLTRREDLPSEYGTRHRAALGLSEQSDALVIIVSEERGVVSVAKGAAIAAVDRSGLGRKLRDHAGIRLTSGTNILSEKVRIALAAAFAILFVTGIWFNIARGLDTLATFDIPVEYMNRNPAQEIIATSTDKIKLQVSGSYALIKTIREDQLRVRIDLNKAATGSNTFTISQENLTLPPGLVLKEVDPSVIEVSLDTITEKKLPVQADWVGKLAEDLIMVRATPAPDRIPVIGGSRMLESLSTLYTEPIPLDDIKTSGRVAVKPAVNPAKLKIAPSFKGSVTVEYIVEKRDEK
jgi:diadenylate cyclase